MKANSITFGPGRDLLDTNAEIFRPGRDLMEASAEILRPGRVVMDASAEIFGASAILIKTYATASYDKRTPAHHEKTEIHHLNAKSRRDARK